VKSIPDVVPDGLSIIMSNALRRLDVKAFWVCYICKKLINITPRSRFDHLKAHIRDTSVAHHSEFNCFVCYEELVVVIMSVVKINYKIVDLVRYVGCLDKVYNEIFGITSLFCSLGSHCLNENASSFQNCDVSG